MGGAAEELGSSNMACQQRRPTATIWSQPCLVRIHAHTKDHGAHLTASSLVHSIWDMGLDMGKLRPR